jgi:cysteinyl-tRNA synthetase
MQAPTDVQRCDDAPSVDLVGHALLREICPALTHDAQDIGEEHLLLILETREQWRHAKDWARADAIKEALRATGIEVCDRDKTWVNVDGSRGNYGGIMGGQSKCLLTDEEILALVDERIKARVLRDYTKADAIKAELKDKGVSTYDKECIWIACDGRKGSFAVASGGLGGEHLSGAFEQHHTTPSLVSTRGLFSNAHIDVLVAQRGRARAARDFTAADRIHAELRRNGVEVWDKEGRWNASDGRQGVMCVGCGHDGGSMITSAALMTPQIECLVAQRERARQSRDFMAADLIKEQLRQHGVQVWDKERIWRASDGRSAPLATSCVCEQFKGPGCEKRVGIIGKRGRGESATDSPPAKRVIPSSPAEISGDHIALLKELCPGVSEVNVRAISEVNLLLVLEKREQVREEKDWARADAIKMALRAVGLEVYDKDKTWLKVDGSRGSFGGKIGRKCSMNEADIEQSLRLRAEARSRRDFNKADTIKAELKGKGVEVYDKDGVWVTCDGRQGRTRISPPTAAHDSGSGVSTMGTAEIERMLSQRETARAQKDYGKADCIKNELRRLGVEAWDKEGTWRAADGRRGTYRAAKCDFLATDRIIDQFTRERSDVGSNFGSERAWHAAGGRRGAVLRADATVFQNEPALHAAHQQPLMQHGAAYGAGIAMCTHPEVSEAEVQHYVCQLELVRSHGQHKSADDLKAYLLAHYGVRVYDRERQWHASNGQCGSF